MRASGNRETINGKSSLPSTLLDLTSGNQRFLKGILELSEPFAEDDIQEALFGPWQYRDNNHSLGWDRRRLEDRQQLRPGGYLPQIIWEN